MPSISSRVSTPAPTIRRSSLQLIRAFQPGFVQIGPEPGRGCQVRGALHELRILPQHPSEHLRQLFDRRWVTCPRLDSGARRPDPEHAHDLDEQAFGRARLREHRASRRNRGSRGLRVVRGDQSEHGNPVRRESRFETPAELNSRLRALRTLGQHQVGSKKRRHRHALVVVPGAFELKANCGGAISVLQMKYVAWIDDQEARLRVFEGRHVDLTVDRWRRFPRPRGRCQRIPTGREA